MRKRKNDVISDFEETVVRSEKVKSERSGASYIGYLLDKLSVAIYKALRGGFLGYIFSAYYSELDSFENGLFGYNLRTGGRVRRFLRHIRGYFAESIENSYFVNGIKRRILYLIDLPVKSYGRFLLSFGIYTLLFYFINLLLPAIGVANEGRLNFCIAICVLSIPLIFSDKTLVRAVYQSKMTKFIFSDIFGYREELFEAKENSNPHYFSGQSMFLGLVLGVLTLFINPTIIIGIIGIFALCAFVFTMPEIGILISFVFLPFFPLLRYPTVFLVFIILTTLTSYIVKVIRGKRIIRMEIIDLAVVFFMLTLYLSGQISVGGMDSYLSALVASCLLLGYFLIVNLIRTEKWVYRCVYCIVFSGTLTAVIGILQYALGYAVNDWLDISLFADIYGRATATFDNPNYLAAYLAAVFPFALYLFNKVSGKLRLLSAFSCVSIVLCVVFTWSRAAWLAIIICFVLYLVIITRKSLKYILGAVALTPLFSLFVPSSVVNRFLSIGNIADSSTLYRLYTWNGCINMIRDYLWGGIGYGQTAFETIYPLYAFAGIETAVHSHNLYLQIIISMGIGGLVMFAAVMFFFAQNSLSYIKAPFNRSTSLITSASLVSVLAMLIIGVFDFVWYNNAVYFMFWSVLALGVACTRIGKRESSRDEYVLDSDERSTSINLYI